MSSPDVNLIPRVHFKVRRTPLTDLSKESNSNGTAEVSIERIRWRPVVLGAATLSLFTVALAFGPVWLVLFGPFALIGLVRTMGIRSLWP